MGSSFRAKGVRIIIKGTKPLFLFQTEAPNTNNKLQSLKAFSLVGRLFTLR
jgi:hypothetical protein